jgi:DNA processing protein
MSAKDEREITRFVGREEAAYPTLLTLAPGAPKGLYYRGDLSVLSADTVAVVGARKATDYGRWAAAAIARRYAEQGVVVVSGMAEGVDTCAHRGALEGGAPTVAVMGCGLDICYPTHNGGLRKRILQTGLLLSEYPDGTRPARYTFPARNRIISGLSMATIIVEAGLSSGALITAEFAATQGREVYAVPGNINRVASVGCNKLIQDGVRPLAFIDDVLTDLGIQKAGWSSTMEKLEPDEKSICRVIEEHGELSINDVAFLAKLSIPRTAALVTMLEMKGLLSNYAGKVLLRG